QGTRRKDSLDRIADLPDHLPLNSSEGTGVILVEHRRGSNDFPRLSSDTFWFGVGDSSSGLAERQPWE
ncbi:MAG: hypothetical protein P8Y94_04765, partial [Acidobacteriota bacterium]